MEWSADAAVRQMWSEFDQTETNGEVMRFFREHLQKAFDAGRNQEAAAWREHVLKLPAATS